MPRGIYKRKRRELPALPPIREVEQRSEAYEEGYRAGEKAREADIKRMADQAKALELSLLHDFKWMVMHFVGREE
jgi:hypothetical protein